MMMMVMMMMVVVVMKKTAAGSVSYTRPPPPYTQLAYIRVLLEGGPGLGLGTVGGMALKTQTEIVLAGNIRSQTEIASTISVHKLK